MVAIHILLIIVAYILLVILSPVGFIMAAIFKPKKYFWNIAVSLDQLGNVICSELLRLTLITKESEDPFGNPDETISSVIGKNKKADTLSWFGKRIDGLLDRFDKNHSEDSIEDHENC